MTEGRRAWNAWNVPYFGTATAPRREEPGSFLALANAGSRAAQRIMAVLVGIGAVLGGAAVTGLLLFASFVLSFGSPPSGTEVLVASLLGATVAVVGVVVAVVAYRHVGIPKGVTVHGDRLEVAYHSFKRPMVVPRASVRAVAIDAAPVRPFQNNQRFPVDGELPAEAFADALDRLAGASPGVIWERPDERPGGYGHDDPAEDGWASSGAATPRVAGAGLAFLWTAHGSALPFLRGGGLEAPNVALLFDHPIRTPRPAWWLDITPLISRCGLYRGGREERGLLLYVRDARAAREVLGAWNVVRRITATDVLEEGLQAPKPLVGWRAVAYAGVVVVPLLVQILFRILR